MARKRGGVKPSINQWEDFTKDLGWVDPDFLRAVIEHVGIYVYDIETCGAGRDALDPRKGRLDGIAFYVPVGTPKDFGRLGYYDGRPIRAWFPFNDFSFMCHIKVKDIPGLESLLAPIGVNMEEIYATAVDKDGSPKKPNELILVNLRPPMDQEETMESLRAIWEELPDVIGITHNGKFDTGFMMVVPGTVMPIHVKNIWGDSMLADFCSDERRRRYGLKIRTKQEFNHQMTTYSEAVSGQSLLAFCNAKPLGVYAMDDCYWEYRLHQRSIEKLRAQEPPPTNRTELKWSIEKRFGRVMGRLEKIYWGIDTRISEIIMEMEQSGVLIDWQWLKKVDVDMEKEKAVLWKNMEAFLGWPLNPNKTRHVADALFAPPPDGLGLPEKGIPIGKTGDPSTSDKVIKHFARFHPLVADILKWRSLDTIQGGFVRKLIRLACESPDGRVYAHFNQTRTVIARLSSSDPINFQNQPRDKNLVRKSYCSHRKGIETDDQDILLLGGDYGQIELRVAAHLSLEEAMLEVYRMGGICTDVGGDACERYKLWVCENSECDHKWTPVLWTSPNNSLPCPKCNKKKTEHQARCRHVDLHQRTADDANVKRNPLAKNLNFGLLYRMGAPKFCIYAELFDSDGMPMIDFAKEIIARWHEAYPAIAVFHEATEFNLTRNGWIAKTLFGRRRRLDQEARINRFRAVTQGVQFQVSGCVVPETPILTESGYVPINQLAESKLPIFDGAGFTRDYSVYQTGEKEVFEVKLTDGRTLVCSEDHRLAGMNGLEMSWPKVKELKAGDLVATHDVLAPQGDLDHGVSPDEAYLVGALIGDGYYGSSRGFTLAASAKDPGWPESLDASVKAAFGPWVDGRMRWGLRKTSRGGLVKDLVVLSSRARSSLMVLGLDCVSKQKKRIPDWVYTAPPEVRGACLAGLIDTDGSVLSYKQKDCFMLTVNYSSRVKELVEGAWRLASSLGIDAAIRTLDVAGTSKSSGRTTQYRLDITYRGFRALQRWVPLRHPRKAATLESALLVLAQKAPRRKLPTTFVKAVAALANAAPILASRQGGALPQSTDRNLRRRVQSYVGHARNGMAGENMVGAILDYIGESGAKEALQLGWVAIESITPLGVRPTYDIEIHGKNHAYVANGLLTHNSAQDIMKTGMIRVWDAREKKIANARPAERKLWKGFKFLMQIHDECVWQIHRSIADEAKVLVKTAMEGVGKGYLRLPLTFAVKTGQNWDEVH